MNMDPSDDVPPIEPNAGRATDKEIARQALEQLRAQLAEVAESVKSMRKDHAATGQRERERPARGISPRFNPEISLGSILTAVAMGVAAVAGWTTFGNRLDTIDDGIKTRRAYIDQKIGAFDEALQATQQNAGDLKRVEGAQQNMQANYEASRKERQTADLQQVKDTADLSRTVALQGQSIDRLTDEVKQLRQLMEAARRDGGGPFGGQNQIWTGRPSPPFLRASLACPDQFPLSYGRSLADRGEG